MAGFENNGECVLAYLDLFRDLAGGEREKDCPARLEALRAREEESGCFLAPVSLRERFGLNGREFLLAMAALALEMDGGLRGGFRRTYGLSAPTVEYGLQLIGPVCPAGVETLAELAGQNVLTGLLLIPPGTEVYPLERPLALCRAVLAFLTGPSLAAVPGVEFLGGAGEEKLLPLHEEGLARTGSWYAAGGKTPLTLCGPAGSGRRTLLRRACGGAVCVDLRGSGEQTARDRNTMFREAAAAAVLLGAPVCALPGDRGGELEELSRFCRRSGVPLAVLSEEGETPSGEGETVRLSRRLSPAERTAAWRFFAPRAAENACPEGSMTVGAVRAVSELALRYAADAGREEISRTDLERAVRTRSGGGSPGVWSGGSVSLEDMVLPESVRAQLELICQTARIGPVLSAWGLPGRREGVTAVFHGPSGTGKSMAAAAIAGALGAPLLRADLSRIMDKYVGETEKQLARLLRRGEESRCVLLFDEADALFSRRGEVSGGQDKYANLSTAYLLQEIEEYEGVALLSTNLLSNFDEAFLRRLQFIVRFPLPDAAAREELWRRALPGERLEGEIPFAALAKAELSPARINSAARSAAAAAIAGGRERVDARGLLRALRLELEKSGKPLPRELSGWKGGDAGTPGGAALR